MKISHRRVLQQNVHSINQNGHHVDFIPLQFPPERPTTQKKQEIQHSINHHPCQKHTHTHSNRNPNARNKCQSMKLKRRRPSGWRAPSSAIFRHFPSKPITTTDPPAHKMRKILGSAHRIETISTPKCSRQCLQQSSCFIIRFDGSHLA